MAAESSGHWDPERLIHRQTYISLVRAYLLDYGSQHDLARALGLSEAYASLLLAPLHLGASRHEVVHWSALLLAAGYEVAEAFKLIKTPSLARAQQIADHLCTDAERREVLLHHINLARGSVKPSAPATAPLSASEADAAIRAIGDVHQVALYHSSEASTAASYAQVWRKALATSEAIDPWHNPAGHAQVLMFLHDTAQALGRADLALGFARKAIRITSAGTSRRLSDDLIRLRINAMLAEAVSLNTLRLPREAATTIDHAESLPGYNREPDVWQRSFLEQRLKSVTGSMRASIYSSESTAEAALCLASGDTILQAGIKRRLMDVYLRKPTGRNRRIADELAYDLWEAANSSGISPLRRAQVLRTLARYSALTGDYATMTATISECLRVTIDANLIHQRQELAREFAAPNLPTPKSPAS